MYILWIFPTEHKWMPDREIALVYNKSWADTKLIKIIQKHKKDLGITISNTEIKEIIQKYGLYELNDYMKLGLFEAYEENSWL